MTTDGTNCYTYNDSNQLSQIKNCSTNQVIAQYVYDYQGNRIEKKVYNNGSLQETVYSPNDGYQTTKLASNGATLNTTYYQINDQNVAQKNPDGSKDYILTDNLGSTTELTNQSGAVVETTNYYPYGQIRSGGTQSKFLYTGQENDVETGLDYYNSRYYDSSIQRFIQPDTIISDVYDPQSLNRYSYVENNPLRYTDPSGHGIEAIFADPFLDLIAITAVLFVAITHPAQTKTVITSVINLVQSAMHPTVINTTKTSTALSKPASATTTTSHSSGSNTAKTSSSNGGSSGGSSEGGGSSNSPINIDPQQWVKENGQNPDKGPDGWEVKNYTDPKTGKPGVNYYNPKTEETLHPDFNNPAHGGQPHWDYTQRGMTNKLRISIDGGLL
jgi:RHS repeat-associated protein